MKKSIHSVVKEMFLRDPLAIEALQKGLLNTNAYSKSIRSKIEKKVQKKVKINTITVAINRLRPHLKKLKQELNVSNVKLAPIVNLEVNTPVIVTAFAPSLKLLVSALNIVSDPRHRESIVFLQYSDDELIIAYEAGLVDVVAGWKMPVKWEQKATVIDIELENADDFTNILENLKQIGVKPIMITQHATPGGLIVVDNKDLVKVVDLLSK